MSHTQHYNLLSDSITIRYEEAQIYKDAPLWTNQYSLAQMMTQYLDYVIAAKRTRQLLTWKDGIMFMALGIDLMNQHAHESVKWPIHQYLGYVLYKLNQSPNVKGWDGLLEYSKFEHSYS